MQAKAERVCGRQQISLLVMFLGVVKAAIARKPKVCKDADVTIA